MQLPNHLTIKLFTNPAGNASHSKLITDNLMIRYDQFISKDIELMTFIDGKSYVFRANVPSEKNFKYKTDIFYDVIIEFYPLRSEKDQEKSKKINEYGMRVFSNCPSFMFNFTYIYDKMGALYKKLSEGMYSKKALKEPPRETNPYRIVGIEKSIFYTLVKIHSTTGYTKSKIDKIKIKLPENDPSFKFPGNIFEDIKSQEEKMKEILNIEKVKKSKKTGKKTGSSRKVSSSSDKRDKKKSLLYNELVSDFKGNNLKDTDNLKKSNTSKNNLSKSKLKVKK